jgi:hypothetical protein
MAQSWYDVVHTNALIAIKGAKRAIAPNIPLKPVMEMLGHRETAGCGINSLLKID